MAGPAPLVARVIMLRYPFSVVYLSWMISGDMKWLPYCYLSCVVYKDTNRFHLVIFPDWCVGMGMIYYCTIHVLVITRHTVLF